MNITIATIILFITHITGQPTKSHRRTVRIANGDQFSIDHYTYVVGLKIEHVNENGNVEKIYCTGSLVSPLFVLSAAHCILKGDINIEVYRNNPRNNLTDEKRIVVKLFKHSLFNETSLVSDLCLLKINAPFRNITSYAMVSGYPSPELFGNETTLTCIILGWGFNEFGYPTDMANVAPVRVKYGPDACEVPPDNKFINDFVEQTWKEFLCAVPDNRMTCIGDSGGALMCQGYLFGITSHGYNYYPGMGDLKIKCGDSRVQTRFLFVYNYQKWIDDILYETSERKILRKIFGILKDEKTAEWRKRKNKELKKLFQKPNILSTIQSRKLHENPNGKRPLECHRLRWEDVLRTDMESLGEGLDWY
ncbi:Peptidase S1, PA clan,Serine proteases, trypsin family, histidine active site,Serine proteases, trypsin [Cinara cedri]|uniref:Peptidase S1, PA clan,Serine proteases, trypsin family, histidine active site,Serine proteases, trypsin n=1 Tax=Cinara cedri TaxID=506608 RepID=A0A5E4N3L7_9HEMI|nr:Peptidase S1, PA clan,Serine proteases, trypsin family, histidine active site,Serine proteases, trypsin [Cinara cedri]